MQRTTRWAVGVAAMVVFAMTLSSAFSAEPKPPPPANPFEGKFLLISTSTGHGAVLEKVEVRTLGKGDFLFGRCPQHEFFGGYSGKNVWLNLDHVLQVVEYENLDEVFKVYDQADDGEFKSFGHRPLN